MLDEYTSPPTEHEISTAVRMFDKRIPSEILFHSSGTCCIEAYAWFQSLALVYYELDCGPPIWIRKQWTWGPLNWPAFWCEIADRQVVDCGAFASMARTAFETVGELACSVQLLEIFDTSATGNWRAAWQKRGIGGEWVSGRLAYHEAVALLSRHFKSPNISIWDPSDSLWVEQKPASGYGSLVAIRVVMNPQAASVPERVIWRGHRIKPNSWSICLASPSSPGSTECQAYKGACTWVSSTPPDPAR